MHQWISINALEHCNEFPFWLIVDLCAEFFHFYLLPTSIENTMLIIVIHLIYYKLMITNESRGFIAISLITRRSYICVVWQIDCFTDREIFLFLRLPNYSHFDNRKQQKVGRKWNEYKSFQFFKWVMQKCRSWHGCALCNLMNCSTTEQRDECATRTSKSIEVIVYCYFVVHQCRQVTHWWRTYIWIILIIAEAQDVQELHTSIWNILLTDTIPNTPHIHLINARR